MGVFIKAAAVLFYQCNDTIYDLWFYTTVTYRFLNQTTGCFLWITSLF